VLPWRHRRHRRGRPHGRRPARRRSNGERTFA
jgi:hypothetical protein